MADIDEYSDNEQVNFVTNRTKKAMDIQQTNESENHSYHIRTPTQVVNCSRGRALNLVLSHSASLSCRRRSIFPSGKTLGLEQLAQASDKKQQIKYSIDPLEQEESMTSSHSTGESIELYHQGQKALIRSNKQCEPSIKSSPSKQQHILSIDRQQQEEVIRSNDPPPLQLFQRDLSHEETLELIGEQQQQQQEELVPFNNLSEEAIKSSLKKQLLMISVHQQEEENLISSHNQTKQSIKSYQSKQQFTISIDLQEQIKSSALNIPSIQSVKSYYFEERLMQLSQQQHEKELIQTNDSYEPQLIKPYDSQQLIIESICGKQKGVLIHSNNSHEQHSSASDQSQQVIMELIGGQEEEVSSARDIPCDQSIKSYCFEERIQELFHRQKKEESIQSNISHTAPLIELYHSQQQIMHSTDRKKDELISQEEQFLLSIGQQERINEEYACRELVTNSRSQEKSVIRKHLSRIEIENEIGSMLRNILALDEDMNSETIYVADGYCHLDILFEKLNKPNQSVFNYLHYNRHLYSCGINIRYIIQSYPTTYHIKPENWSKYAEYLKHETVYGMCGIRPMFAGEYSLATELNLRTALSHRRIIGLGEIGLDFISAGCPSAELQEKVFLNQLEIAKEFDLPVIIISKGSFLQTLELLIKVLHSEYLILWRNFEYGDIELNMLQSKFEYIYFSCSPYHLTNKKMQNIIKQVDASKILPESISPHLKIPECPNIWETHPIFVARIYKLISDLFHIPFREVATQMVKNFQNFYHL